MLSDPFQRAPAQRGFTIVELLIGMAIVVTLVALAIPITISTVERMRISRAISDIRTIEGELQAFHSLNLRLPDTLAEIRRNDFLDPWGHPYQYLNFAAGGPGVRGQMRKDRFLVPLNTTYDLYSVGKDGRSKPPLTARDSQDDIVRANDGGFVGLASDY